VHQCDRLLMQETGRTLGKHRHDRPRNRKHAASIDHIMESRHALGALASLWAPSVNNLCSHPRKYQSSPKQVPSPLTKHSHMAAEQAAKETDGGYSKKTHKPFHSAIVVSFCFGHNPFERGPVDFRDQIITCMELRQCMIGSHDSPSVCYGTQRYSKYCLCMAVKPCKTNICNS
jgi:hypothetical protein